MDVDLSTDLRGAAAARRAAAVGPQRPRDRHAPRARLARRPRAEARAHLARLQPPPAHASLRARFSDAQCGFKAVRRDALDGLLADVRDDGWFFDTELLVLAQRRGLRIHEVPVDWVDDPDSRVDIVRTALDRPQGRRAAAAPPARSRGSWASACSARSPTRCCSSLLRGPLGADGANAAALALTARRQHGGQPPADVRRARPRGPRAPARRAARSSSCSRSALTNGALAVLHGLDRRPAARGSSSRCWSPRALIATVTRYVALRTWVFARARRAARRSVAPSRLDLRPGAARMSATARPPRRAGERDRRAADRCAGSRRPAARFGRRSSLSPRRALPLGPDDQRLLEQYYAAAARAGERELEGLVLRRARPGQLHHRRQAAAVAVADGPLGAGASASRRFSMLLPAGAVHDRRRRPAVRDRPARRSARPPGSSPPRRSALTPITDRDRARQQPRRAARPAARRLRLAARAGDRVRPRRSTCVLVRRVVGLAFMTKMLQGWMVVPALAAAYLLAGPPRLLVRVRQLAARRRRDGRRQRRVAARGVAVAGLASRTSAAAPTARSGT